MGQSFREELVRAYHAYFKLKGSPTPSVPGEILPVVILDDNAPYPAFRRWMGGTTANAVAAQYSYICWGNNDPQTTKSVVVIDEIFWRQPNNDDITVGITLTSNLPTSVVATDAAEEKDQSATDRPRIGNVGYNALSTASNFAGETVPLNATPFRGPWTLGPGAVLFVRPNTVNELIAAYARGRYYPGY